MFSEDPKLPKKNNGSTFWCSPWEMCIPSRLWGRWFQDGRASLWSRLGASSNVLHIQTPRRSFFSRYDMILYCILMYFIHIDITPILNFVYYLLYKLCVYIYIYLCVYVYRHYIPIIGDSHLRAEVSASESARLLHLEKDGNFVR